MGLKDFRAALEALPEKASNDDIIDFLAGVAVSFMPPEAAVPALILAAKRVAKYAQDVGDNPNTECNCPRCTAERAERTKH